MTLAEIVRQAVMKPLHTFERQSAPDAARHFIVNNHVMVDDDKETEAGRTGFTVEDFTATDWQFTPTNDDE
jgi:hypothetical protein